MCLLPLCGCLATIQLNSFLVAAYLYCLDSSSVASGEKRTVQGVTKGDEESNSLKSQEGNLSEDRYHSNGVSLNRNEAVVAGHYSPHSAVHFLPPQVIFKSNYDTKLHLHHVLPHFKECNCHGQNCWS